MMATAVKLAVLFALAMLTNGPWSPVVPTGTEPLVMLYARILPPLVVAGIATLAALVAEVVNWKLYDAALGSRRLAAVRDSHAAGWVTAHFARTPFLTTVACAIVPVPFWLARCAAILAHYPRRRFFPALALGRFAWWSACAALGNATAATPVWIAAGLVLLGGLWAFGAWAGARADATSS